MEAPRKLVLRWKGVEMSPEEGRARLSRVFAQVLEDSRNLRHFFAAFSYSARNATMRESEPDGLQYGLLAVLNFAFAPCSEGPLREEEPDEGFALDVLHEIGTLPDHDVLWFFQSASSGGVDIDDLAALCEVVRRGLRTYSGLTNQLRSLPRESSVEHDHGRPI